MCLVTGQWSVAAAVQLCLVWMLADLLLQVTHVMTCWLQQACSTSTVELVRCCRLSIIVCCMHCGLSGLLLRCAFLGPRGACPRVTPPWCSTCCKRLVPYKMDQTVHGYIAQLGAAVMCPVMACLRAFDI
jgi:hypothetical protein